MTYDECVKKLNKLFHEHIRFFLLSGTDEEALRKSDEAYAAWHELKLQQEQNKAWQDRLAGAERKRKRARKKKVRDEVR